MLFNSPEFLFGFLPVVLLAYALVRGVANKAMVHGVLLFASLFFYAWWDVAYLPLLLFTIGGNFALARIMWWRPKTRRWCLMLGVALNVGLLAHYKYSAFLIGDVLGFPGVVNDAGLASLPLGISFFSFQQLAWLFDAARTDASRTSLPIYALFVTFFPQLIAGPIVHHRELVPQLMSSQLGRVPPAAFAAGFSLFAIGLFKKVVIADSFAPTADAAFRMCSQQQLIYCLQAWTGLASYMCQIYFDFSGYSDMALGLGLLFGITLPINFASPYKARDMADFWRRWHITLSQFLRDFVYIPLGGNRTGLFRQTANLICTMAVGGLWHGAGYTFLAWGLLHGVMLAAVHLHRNLLRSFPRVWGSVGLAARPMTFLAIMMTWVLFRAESLSASGFMYLNLFPPAGIALEQTGLVSGCVGQTAIYLPEIGRTAMLAATLGLLACVVLPSTTELFHSYLGADAQAFPRGSIATALAWRSNAAWALATGILFFFAVMDMFAASPSAFLYFQF
jgi:alginate O-acetyltransferase complex protein AlgI